jgi:hypothetical protein
VTNTSHLISGRTYRIAVYRTANGYSSFAERETHSPCYLGATGHHSSPQTARLTALCLARADAAAHARHPEGVC